MICAYCKKEIEDGAMFCPSCGVKVEDSLNHERKSAAVSDVFGDNTASISDTPSFGTQSVQDSSPAGFQIDLPVSNMPLQQEKPKEFFGRGAFVLCLIIIALLSASTGIFAYLYFSLAGRI